MAEFVRKAAIGFKEVHGGQSNPDCTHVILTKEEYKELIEKISKAEGGAEEAIYLAERNVQDEKRKIQERVDEVEAIFVQKEIELKNVLDAERNECELQRRLNVNLLRIARERANADRKLRPKKEHTGYVVVASMEKEHRYKSSDGYWKHVVLWETILETPYIVRFEEPEVKNLTQELFRYDEENEKWMISRIGINAKYERGYADMVRNKGWKEYARYNVIVDRRLKANYRTGYWEIIFLHTKPLVSVPVDMMPRMQ